MAPPYLKQQGNRIVRTDTEAIKWLWGPHLFWMVHKNTQNAADAEHDAVAHTFSSQSNAEPGWDSNFIQQFIPEGLCGEVDVNGNEVTSYTDEFGNVLTIPDPTWLAHMDSLVNLCMDNDTHILLSWAWEFTQKGHHKLIDDHGRANLRYLARRYGPGWVDTHGTTWTNGAPAVFFKTQSEPLGEFTWQQIKDTSEPAIDEIRAEWPDVLVGFPGEDWSQRFPDWVSDPPNRSNIFACAHCYQGRTDEFQPGPLIDSVAVQQAMDIYNAGWPIVVGECGAGGRSTVTDLQELFDHCQANDWALSGWALTALYDDDLPLPSPRMSDHGPILDSDGNLTEWGILMRDESRAWFNLAPPAAPPEPDPAPDVTTPSGTDFAVKDHNILWTDGSWNTTVMPDEASAWVEVTHDNNFGGFQMQAPHNGNRAIANYQAVHLLMHASSAILDDLRLRLYETHQAGSPNAFVGAGTGTPLSSYETIVGNGWRHITIPLSEFNFGNFDTLVIARMELENQAGAPMDTYYVNEFALTRVLQVGSIEFVSQPQSTPEGEIIGGPPGVVVRDTDGALMEGVTVQVSLNKNAFSGDSITAKVSDANGEILFDFLKINVQASGYEITAQEG